MRTLRIFRSSTISTLETSHGPVLEPRRLAFLPSLPRLAGKARTLAMALIRSDGFDLIHQLNMIGYREPGYLWALDLPYVWGPIRRAPADAVAFSLIAWRKGGAFYALRNTLNVVQIQRHLACDVRCGAVLILIAATPVDVEAIQRHHGRESRLVSETGCETSINSVARNR